MSDVCRSCKAPVRWVITEHDRPVMLDPEPVENGNIRLAVAATRGGKPRAIVVPEDQRAALAGELYRFHFASCPFADQHRRRRR